MPLGHNIGPNAKAHVRPGIRTWLPTAAVPVLQRADLYLLSFAGRSGPSSGTLRLRSLSPISLSLLCVWNSCAWRLPLGLAFSPVSWPPVASSIMIKMCSGCVKIARTYAIQDKQNKISNPPPQRSCSTTCGQYVAQNDNKESDERNTFTNLHTRFSAFVCLRGAGGWRRRARAITAPSRAAATTGVDISLHAILPCVSCELRRIGDTDSRETECGVSIRGW